MISRRAPLLAGAVLLATPVLSGCVAAAIPALAASGVLGTQLRDNDEGSVVSDENRVPIDYAEPAGTAAESAPAPGAAAYFRTYTLPDGTRMEVMAGAPGAGAGALAEASPSPVGHLISPTSALATAPTLAPAKDVSTAPVTGATFTLADGTTARIVSGPLPAPGTAAPGATAVGGYDAFAGFATRQGTLPIAGVERRSAILESPGTLEPATRECSIHPAAVLIDLDPASGTLDPAAALHGDPRLAGALAGLRGEGIAVGWLSANTADRAGAVRRALVASGLDPAGQDELALLRYPEERKQSRREEFAKEYCLVAIAGDNRTDFDELFQYLKDPSLATPLEPLIGNGWFLIPQPLT